jgi:hypothetical protein
MQALVGLVLAISVSQAAPAATTGGIAGRVTVAGSNTAIAGARVMLMPAGRPSGPIGVPPQTTTDQDGRFVFDGLAPGNYRLDVQKTGFAPLSGPGTPPRLIQVAAGQIVDGVSLQLQRGGVIAGKVFDPSGEPLTDARIMAMRRMGTPTGAAPRFIPAPMQGPQQTNDLGEFRVSGLAPGEYYVAAIPGGALAFGGPATAPASSGNAPTALTTTFYPGTTDPASGQSIAVTPGAEVNIVITMQSAPAFRVSGLVVDPDGTPVARAMVMMMGDPRSGLVMGPIGTAQTQEDGRFVIGNIPSGSYRLTATVPITTLNAAGGGGVSGGTFTTFSSSGGGIELPPPVVVADSDVGGVRLVVRRPPQ